ncbi:MAG: SDR family NAD(P)-dependent oxidoreductase, partial [Pseudomonadota bacterium]
MQSAFTGKTAVVTGASAGVGEAVAHAFARQGANVVLVARREGPLAAVARAIEADGGKALELAMDVCDTAACERLFERAVETFGAVHFLINNAGFHQRGPVEDNGAA